MRPGFQGCPLGPRSPATWKGVVLLGRKGRHRGLVQRLQSSAVLAGLWDETPHHHCVGAFLSVTRQSRWGEGSLWKQGVGRGAPSSFISQSCSLVLLLTPWLLLTQEGRGLGQGLPGTVASQPTLCL